MPRWKKTQNAYDVQVCYDGEWTSRETSRSDVEFTPLQIAEALEQKAAAIRAELTRRAERRQEAP